MNGTEARSDEITRYLDGVRAALADLPDDVRDELLEDLPAHLAEVASEDPDTLDARLGAPADYAAELRAAAGLRPGPGRQVVPPNLTLFLARLRGWAGRADRRVGRLIGYARLTDFLPLLRPAWWVVRGYVAVVIFVGLPTGMAGMVPSVGGDVLIGWVLLLAAIAGSIWLGPLAGRWRRGLPRYALLGGNVLLGILALVVLSALNDDIRGARQASTSVVVEDPNGNVTDVIPVGPDGRPLTGVTLLDQNGNELDLGQPWTCHNDAEDKPVIFRYPLCLDPNAVLGVPRDSTSPGVTSPTASLATTAAPTPDATRATTPSPSAVPGTGAAASAAAPPGGPPTATPSR
jgi:hypothetical protein